MLKSETDSAWLHSPWKQVSMKCLGKMSHTAHKWHLACFIVGCFGQVLRALASKNTRCGHEPLVHFQVTPSLISAVHSLGSVSASPVVLSLFSSQDHEQIRAASCDASQASSNPAPRASSLSSTLPSCSSYATRHRSGPSRSLRCFELHQDVLPTICCNDTSLT